MSSSYAPSRWLLDCHLQTIFPAIAMRHSSLTYQRVIWQTPDGDIIALDWLSQQSKKPLVVLFHGLEGSSQSHYATRIMHHTQSLGWNGVVIHFRGCGGIANVMPRSYHSGDSAEIDWILNRLHKQHDGNLYAVGVSLGGNALLKWLGEQQHKALLLVKKAVAISAPLSLPATGHALGKGLNKLYTQLFLSTLKPKALNMIQKYGLNFDTEAIKHCRTLWEFDNLFTAPLHGFANADDYWQRANCRPHLNHIQLPTMLINAQNDPFLPAKNLPQTHEVSPSVIRVFTQYGGHVGFAGKDSQTGQDWLAAHIHQFFGTD